MSKGGASYLDSPTQGIPSIHPGIGCCLGLVSLSVEKKQFTTKPDKRETTKTGTENPPLTKPVRMKDIGESPTWEANRPMRGRKIRYNTKETKPMNITKQQLRIGNWNVQGLNAPGKIDVLADECEQYQLDIVALTELHWPGQGRTSHNKWEIILITILVLIQVGGKRQLASCSHKQLQNHCCHMNVYQIA